MTADPTRTIMLDSGARVVLADPGAGSGTVNNITCFHPDGRVAWKPEMPIPADAGDSWVEIERRGDSLLAWTWSCYCCEIDTHTGKLLSKRFTK